MLTHCGWVTRILVFYISTVQTGNDNYVFKTRVISTPYTLKLRKNVAFLRMVLLTDIYRSVISPRMNEQLPAFLPKKAPVHNVLRETIPLCVQIRYRKKSIKHNK